MARKMVQLPMNKLVNNLGFTSIIIVVLLTAIAATSFFFISGFVAKRNSEQKEVAELLKQVPVPQGAVFVSDFTTSSPAATPANGVLYSSSKTSQEILDFYKSYIESIGAEIVSMQNNEQYQSMDKVITYIEPQSKRRITVITGANDNKDASKINISSNLK